MGLWLFKYSRKYWNNCSEHSKFNTVYNFKRVNTFKFRIQIVLNKGYWEILKTKEFLSKKIYEDLSLAKNEIGFNDH